MTTITYRIVRYWNPTFMGGTGAWLHRLELHHPFSILHPFRARWRDVGEAHYGDPSILIESAQKRIAQAKADFSTKPATVWQKRVRMWRELGVPFVEEA